MWIPHFIKGAAVAAICQSASAVTLVNYDFTTDLSPTAPLTAGVSGTAFTGQTGRSTGLYVYRFTQTPAPYQMQFSLSATGGNLLDLSTISFKYDFLQSGGTVSNLNATFSLFYSLDNFASAGTLVQTFNDSSGAAITMGAPAFNNSGALDLSAIPNTASVSFRFVFANGDSLNTNTYRYSIDDVLVDGAVIVPEPSASLLAAAGTGIAFGIRRRRR